MTVSGGDSKKTRGPSRMLHETPFFVFLFLLGFYLFHPTNSIGSDRIGLDWGCGLEFDAANGCEEEISNGFVLCDTFGKHGRDKRENIISILYACSVNLDNRPLAEDQSTFCVEWDSMDRARLFSDHGEMLECGISRLAAQKVE